jgi:hypothetical protein
MRNTHTHPHLVARLGMCAVHLRSSTPLHGMVLAEEQGQILPLTLLLATIYGDKVNNYYDHI